MFRLLKRNGEPVRDGCEWAPMFVEVLVPGEHWESAELLRNDQRLPLVRREIGGTMRIIAEWPRAGCGSYELFLIDRGEEHRQRVDVLPRKLRRTALVRMLDDLEGGLPASVALALQRIGGLSGLQLLDPAESALNEEVHRMRRAILGTGDRPGIATILRELSTDPHRVLQRNDQWTDAERARRPHPARLAEALSKGHNIGSNGKPMRLIDPQAVYTADCYENRFIHSYVLLLERRIRYIRRALQVRRVPRSTAELDTLAETLRTARRQADFLDDVGELTSVPDRESMVLLKRSAYRAALAGYLEYQRRHSVRLEDRALDTPLENIPYLYQVWGTLRVIRLLIEVASSLGYKLQRQNLVKRTRDGVIIAVLPGGRPVLSVIHPETGAEVHVRAQASFRDSGEIRSVTYEQRPDVAVVVQRAGSRAKLYLFDPKYKLEGDALETAADGDAKPKKSDIDKMHAYRDAIRDIEGHHSVAYAAIMYPGPGVQYPGAGVEALSAVPGSTAILDERLRDVLRPPLSLHAGVLPDANG